MSLVAIRFASDVNEINNVLLTAVRLNALSSRIVIQVELFLWKE